MRAQRLILCVALMLAVMVGTGHAKTVVCLDDHDDPGSDDDQAFLNNHEGWVRAMGLGGDDVIQRGGSLTDCLALLENGDRLIIIAHGTGNGSCFAWGGMEYTGFGPGAGQGTNPHPVPPGFNNLMNIMVDFCTCWSNNDPDSTGTDRPLTEKIRDAMGGAGNGHAVNGFTDLATATVCWTMTWVGGTAAECSTAFALASQCLANDASWMEEPPVNRPGAATNQQTAGQAIVDACPGIPAGVTLTFMIPNQIGVQGGQAGYKPPVNRAGPPAPGTGASGCACDELPGCGFGEQDGMGEPEGTVAATLTNYSAYWTGSHVEVVWQLIDIESPLTFEIHRSSDDREVRIKPERVVRYGNDFSFEDAAVEAGQTYDYRVRMFERGRLVASFETRVTTPAHTFALAQNRPNPFNPSTLIEFKLERSELVSLLIYDASGKLVRQLISGKALDAGTYVEEWDGRDAGGRAMASGVYFYRLRAGSQVLTRKAVLLK